MEQNTRDIHGIKFIRDEDFILREIAGEAVLVPVGENTELSNSIISLNETSVFLWKLFDHPVTYDEVLDEVYKEYEDPEGTIRIDVFSFINDFVAHGLIKEVE